MTSFPILMIGFLFLFIDDCYPKPRFGLEQAGTIREANKSEETLGSILLDKASTSLRLKQQQQQQKNHGKSFGFFEDINSSKRPKHVTRVKRNPQTCVANVTVSIDPLRAPSRLQEMVCKTQSGCNPVWAQRQVIYYRGMTTDGVRIYSKVTNTYVANCVISS